MLIEKFIEVPNTNIKEPVLSNQFDSELCYQIAEDFGYAEIVWYALNGKRVVEGSYGDPALVGLSNQGVIHTMSFFKHVQLHKYDLTDKGVSQACRDEIIADNPSLENVLSDEQIQVLADDMREKFKDYMRPLFAQGGGYMDTGLYRDIVYTEYMLEHDLTWEEMMQKTHTDEMLKRVAHMEWQDTQRTAWMSGDTPQYTVPDDCPF